MSHYIERPEIICPHCEHGYDESDMEALACNWRELAAEENDTEVQCLICDEWFMVRVGFTPIFSTAFTKEELDYHIPN